MGTFEVKDEKGRSAIFPLGEMATAIAQELLPKLEDQTAEARLEETAKAEAQLSEARADNDVLRQEIAYMRSAEGRQGLLDELVEGITAEQFVELAERRGFAAPWAEATEAEVVEEEGRLEEAEEEPVSSAQIEPGLEYSDTEKPGYKHLPALGLWVREKVADGQRA